MRLSLRGAQSLFLLLALATLVLVVQACASLGVSAPATFNQKAVAAHSTVEGVAKTATGLRLAGKLSDQDRDNVVASLRAAEQAIDIATLTAKADPAGGTAKLDAAIAALTALSTYLATKGP